ncbi:MAG: AAA family ATPase [Bacillota bacterium]|nr:AAA family ATPase [Bacillota bacterium]
MYLKKIEVKGFKSFADRTAIQPAFGVTCVVGPNGSGKSNITDAIRWVLGEQGAKVLRGEKMEDIIFSGTGKRASLGFAEVKLVVDNADGLLPFDFEEIEISRRLYRSGESEYRINDTTARLKDIRDLFADTGVGLEGYSIIGQGRIDEIVGASPQDRRLLFDEAAGITAFKMKKAEAEKQLKSAEDDLKEVRIRLEEAEGSIEVLKHEAERAERYLALSGRLREIKINEYAEGYQSTRKLFERASAKLEESDAQSRLFAEQREECEARRDSHVSMLQEAQAKLRATDKERYELAGRIRAIDTDLLLADEKRHGIEKQLKSLASRGATGVQAYEKKVAARAELQVEVSQRRESLEVLKREIDEASASMGERFAKLAQLKASVEEKRRAERDFLTEMDRAHARKAENERLAGALEVEHAEMRESALQEGRVSELREKLDDLIAEGAKFADGEAGLSESLISVRSGISHLEKDAVRLRAEAGFHRDSMDSFSDYEHAVQTLMKNKSSDILGVVGELFRVDKKYEDAIETALGRNIGVLVCEKAETAKKYIEEIRANRGGRVSFMPLEDVREGEKPDFSRFELKEGDFEGLAADLITCDEKFRPVFNVLLGSILVASDFEAGRRLLKLGKRVVTLRGEVFIPGGIVTGGATARSGRILSRRRLAAAERELRNLKAEERRIQEETEALRSKVLMHENLMSKTRLELALAETEFETRRKQIQDKKMRYESEKKRLGAEREEIAELIRISAEGLSDAQKSIEEGGVEIAALEHASGEKTEELTRLKVEQARATEQYSAKSDEIERLSGEIAEFESEQSGINEEVER